MEFMEKGPGDAAELSEYLYPIWHEVFDPLMPWEEAEYIFRAWTNPEAIVEAMSKGYVFGYVFCEGSRIGLYSYRLQEDGRFYINKLYLEKEYRGKGLGSEAIRMMMDLARSSGCPEVYLNVYYRNEKAIAAYKRAGMTGYRYKESIGNGYYRDDYIMSVKLRSAAINLITGR
jgi:RimJ/RimL family protein N-acetyltransferase